MTPILWSLARKTGFSWRCFLLFCFVFVFVCFVSVSSSGLEATAMPCPEYRGGRKKAKETHCHVVPQVLSSPGSPPSFHINRSPMLAYYVCPGLFSWAKGRRPFHLGQNQKSSIMCFSIVKSNTNVRKQCQD